jgi:hypothetical protein
MAKQKSTLSEVSDMLTKTASLLRGQYKVTSAGVVSAIIGGLIKLNVLTETFPQPFDVVGNVIIFAAVLMVVIDIARGGLMD